YYRRVPDRFLTSPPGPIAAVRSGAICNELPSFGNGVCKLHALSRQRQQCKASRFQLRGLPQRVAPAAFGVRLTCKCFKMGIEIGHERGSLPLIRRYSPVRSVGHTESRSSKRTEEERSCEPIYRQNPHGPRHIEKNGT